MEPRVYHFGRLGRIYYSVIGFGFLGASVYFFYRFGIVATIPALLLGLPGLFFCRYALLSRLTLTETQISVRYAFGEKSAPLSGVEYWDVTRGSRDITSYWVLHLRNNAGKLTISQLFDVDDPFLDRLSNLGINRAPLN